MVFFQFSTGLATDKTQNKFHEIAIEDCSMARSLAKLNNQAIIVAGYSQASFVEKTQKENHFTLWKYSYDLKRLLTKKTLIGLQGHMHCKLLTVNSSIYIAGVKLPNVDSNTEMLPKHDVAVYRIDPSTLHIVSSFVVSGDGYDFVRDITFDRDGNIILTGYTSSNDIPYLIDPLTPPADLKNIHNYGFDGFIIKIDKNLHQVLAAKRIGGSGDDYIYALDRDSDDNIYIVGNTNSQDYPVQTSAATNKHIGSTDIVVTKVSSDLKKILASTFLGGRTYDYGRDIHIESNGDILISGYTANNHRAIRVAKDTAQNFYGGGIFDVLVARIDNTMSRIDNMTFLGGSNEEFSRSICSYKKKIYLSGTTASHDFAQHFVTLSHNGGVYDIFSSILSEDMKSIYNISLSGGNGNDYIYDTQIIDGNLHFVGSSLSSDFPASKKSKIKNATQRGFLQSISLEQ